MANNVELNIVAKFKDEILAKLKKTEQSFESLRREINKVNRVAEKGKAIFQNWANIHFLVQDSVRGVTRSFQMLWGVLKEGAFLEEQEEAFRRLALSYGENGRKIIEELDKIAKGTIDRAEIIRQGARAMVLGINPAQLSKLMEIARASAKAMGEDVGFMFESIAMGIARQSKMILDNLGIVISVSKAYEDYARKLGKTVEQLTEAEKRQAFLNATLEAGEEIIQRVGGVTDSTADNVRKLQSAWADFKQSLSRAVASVKFLSKALVWAAEKLSEFANREVSLPHDVYGLTIQLEMQKEKVEELTKKWKEHIRILSEFKNMSLSGKSTQRLVKDLQEAISKYRELQKELEEAQEKEAKELVESKIAAQLSAMNKERLRFIDELNSKIDALRESDLKYQLQKLEKEVNAWRKAYGWDGEISKMIDQFYSLKLKQLKDKFSEVNTTVQQFANTLKTSLGDVFFNVLTNRINRLKDVFKSFGLSIVRIFSNRLAEGFLSRLNPFGLFGHQLGTPYIPKTGLYLLHKGERVVPSHEAGGTNVGINVVVNQYIQSWDVQDVWRNRKVLATAISEEIKNNASIRGVLKRYG